LGAKTVTWFEPVSEYSDDANAFLAVLQPTDAAFTSLAEGDPFAWAESL
jgi:hypothetical protein